MGLMVFFFFLMIRLPPRSTQSRSSAASDVYKRQLLLIAAALVGVVGPLKSASERALLAGAGGVQAAGCLLYTSPSPRDRTRSRMPSSA